MQCFGRFQDRENLYLIFEFLQGGDLLRLRNLLRVFSLELTQFYLAEILEALDHLHCRNVVYRGLKPENVVLDGQGHIRLVDFGMVKKVEDGERCFTVTGTPEYLAPEVILKAGHGEEVDLWTLGIVLFEFLTGKLPFTGRSPMVLYDKILNLEPNFSKIGDCQAQELCRQLLQKDFGNRIGVREVRKHKFFEGVDWRMVRMKKVKPLHVPSVSSPLDSSNFLFVDEVMVSQPFVENVGIFAGFG